MFVYFSEIFEKGNIILHPLASTWARVQFCLFVKIKIYVQSTKAKEWLERKFSKAFNNLI